jgi:curved DNA-binding protein CbpA
MTVMTMGIDLYGVLQVDPRAEPTVIQAAYHALARRVHPDRSHTDDTAPAMALLNRAYGVLRDPEQRKAYDRTRTTPVAVPVQDTIVPEWRTASPQPESRVMPPSSAGQANGSMLGFGRYEGWTLQQVGRQDPDYLEWLRRHSSGVGYRREIDTILAAKQAAATPPPVTKARRGRW